MPRIRTLLILLPVVCSARAAYGHALHVQCGVVAPDRVFVEASWGNDEPVAQAAVTVFDAGGNTLLSGTTDAAGRFECTIETPQALIVEVVFAGHRGECSLSAAQFAGRAANGEVTSTAVSHSHEHDPAHGHEHGDDHDREGDTANRRDAATTRDAASHDDDHRAELAAGIALILSIASFLMVLSLRRDVKMLVETSRGERS